MSKKTQSRINHSRLDPLTISWMLYNPDTKQGIQNPNTSISKLIIARECSRHQVLIDEQLSPPPIQQGGMWMTVNFQDNKDCAYWYSFEGLPPMHGEFGPRKGRKARMREAIAKL